MRNGLPRVSEDCQSNLTHPVVKSRNIRWRGGRPCPPIAVDAADYFFMSIALFDPTCARNSYFWILPVAVRGNSPNFTTRGTL